MKIKKAEKLVANLHDKTEYVILIKKLKQAWNNGLVLKNVHRNIKFNQNAWLKTNTVMNTDLRKKNQKMILNFFFFKLVNNALFGKTIENVRKQGY